MKAKYTKTLAVAVFLSVLATGAFAQNQEYVEQETKAYRDCIALSKSDAEAALDQALTWRETGGGLPARHCVAIAEISLGQYEEGALELEILADEMRRGVGWSFPSVEHPNQRGLLADVYAQGGNAWLLAGDPIKAYNLFTLGLSEAEEKSKAYANLLIDRALAQGEFGNYEGALEDLEEVEKLVKPAPELSVLKASAYRSLENFAAAQAELNKAFRLDSQNGEAFLEQGNLLRQIGDNDGARENWMAYLRLYPNGAAADIIRTNLEKMDVNVEDGIG